VLNRRGGARLARRVSGPGLGLWALAVTFAAIDWMMSLEPFWTSTIYGMLVGAGQVLAAFAFGILALVLSAGPAVPDVPESPAEDVPVRPSAQEAGPSHPAHPDVPE